MTPQAPVYSPGGQQPRPYVRFERRAVEDRTKSLTEGQTCFVDKTWVVLMAPGSRDTTETLAADWLAWLDQSAREGRVPAQWPQEYREALATWERSQDQPVNGTSLRNWPAISPAQLQNCIGANILSIEDLAQANSEALARIGMGAVSLRAMAESWLKERSSTGSLSIQVQDLTNRLEAAMQQVEELKKLVPSTTAKA